MSAAVDVRERSALSKVARGFLYSCWACCAAEVATYPIDTAKTRLQLQGEMGAAGARLNSFSMLARMYATEGATSWFKGLNAALLRQATYGSIRYGAYEPIKKLMLTEEERDAPPLFKKVLAGVASGAISSAICNPTDLVKVRMQADFTGTRYPGVWQAFASIFKAEGIAGLYRGVGPTCARASVGAAAELSTYDEIKTQIISRGWLQDGVKAHFSASLCAGFISTLCLSPFDVVKSRVMNQKVDAAGRGLLYDGMVDCIRKSVRSEGITSLWKGFWPNYARVGPRVVIIFLLLEEFRSRFG